MAELVRIFKTVAELIINLVKFIPKLLADLVMVIELVLGAVSQLPTLFIVFPSVISALLISVFGVVVIYKILGREG